MGWGHVLRRRLPDVQVIIHAMAIHPAKQEPGRWLGRDMRGRGGGHGEEGGIEATGEHHAGGLTGLGCGGRPPFALAHVKRPYVVAKALRVREAAVHVHPVVRGVVPSDLARTGAGHMALRRCIQLRPSTRPYVYNQYVFSK